MGSYSADVDLRLECPQSDILERKSWVLIYRPQEDGHSCVGWWLANFILVGTFSLQEHDV